jgi:hypothetical protein
MSDYSPGEKLAADRLRREMQAADAPKAWAAYQADIERTRARTAALRAERLAREAALRAKAPTGPTPRKRKSRSS